MWEDMPISDMDLHVTSFAHVKLLMKMCGEESNLLF